MTGFARAQGDELGISWVWEIKSVNGKSLDLRLRLAPGFDALEPQLRALLAQRFRRGNFSATLAVVRTQPAVVRVNRETLAQLVALMNELAGEIEAAPRARRCAASWRRSKTNRMPCSRNAAMPFATAG